MSDSRFELKVGVFVCVGTVLIALLILNFSKGTTLGKSTYTLRLVLPNASGLKPAADVMMAGVAIGKVSTMELADDTKSVNITIEVLSRYKLRKDSKFHIDALGFLGDQYISVSAPNQTGLAQTNEVGYLQNGDTVQGEPVFDMTEAVRSISSVVDQAHKVMKDLDQAITNVNASALSPETLAHVSLMVSNLQVVAERASGAATRADNLLKTNEQPVDQAIRHFETMSATLTNTAAELDAIVTSNRQDVRTLVTNLTQASAHFDKLADDLQLGKGPINGLLKDEQMTANLAATLSNAAAITGELKVFGSNLNQKGIWAMLWKPKQARESEPEPAPSPRTRP